MTPAVWLVWSCSGEQPTKAPKRTFESRADARYPAPPVFPDGPIDLGIGEDIDDGTLSGDKVLSEGIDGINHAGGNDRIVLRFDPPDTLASLPLRAVLQLPVVAQGGTGPIELRISGRVDDTTGTAAAVIWTIPTPWPDPYAGMPKKARRAPLTCAPFERVTPDLTPILAELAMSETWATRPLTFVIEATKGELRILDSQTVEDAECEGRVTPRLELFPTLRSTFLGKELLGRPTDRSVTVTMWSLVDVEVAVDVAGRTTPVVSAPAGAPIEVLVDGLEPSTAYALRVRTRRPGTEAWDVGPETTFHTARAKGEPFTFTVTSDGHFLNMEHRRAHASMHLMRATMERAATDEPDFHLDLGDSLNSESYRSYDAPDDEEVLRRDLAVRPYFERVGAPVILVLGNHEGEQGWRNDGLPLRAATARELVFPNPLPGTFYSSGTDEDYAAFTWGDVLIVTLDPYRYTMKKPHDLDGAPAVGDRWDWTLGQAQYDWLVRTLEQSDARYKLVFAHQITGGTNAYGRGGRMGADSYEWGGQAELAEHRPGWPRTIHRVLADSGVTAFVHGHDHVFAYEPPLDGVGYVTVPQPGDARYDAGHAPRTGLAEGSTVIENSGYLRFTTGTDGLKMDYVRSFLPGDGDDGVVAFSHTFVGK